MIGKWHPKQLPANWREKLLKSLATAPVRMCYSMHECALCGRTILLGETYRDRGLDRRAHTKCFDYEASGGKP